jgi:hypothetical protein
MTKTPTLRGVAVEGLAGREPRGWAATWVTVSSVLPQFASPAGLKRLGEWATHGRVIKKKQRQTEATLCRPTVTSSSLLHAHPPYPNIIAFPRHLRPCKGGVVTVTSCYIKTQRVFIKTQRVFIKTRNSSSNKQYKTLPKRIPINNMQCQ